jgi:hypothetical protein
MALVLTPALLIILGSLSLHAGRLRRVGADPHCRKCNYLLHGIPSERCPECGSTLSRAAIVHGEPQRSWRPFLAGWLALLLAGTLIFTGTISRIQNIDWYHYLPTYFVLRDLNSNRPIAVQTAWAELHRRDAASQLSSSARDAMVTFALARQAKATAPYNALDFQVVGYLADRCLAGDLPAPQQSQFIEQALRARLLVRPKVVVGNRVPFVVSFNCLGPANPRFWMKLSTAAVIVDSQPDPGATGRSCCMGVNGAGSFGTSTECPRPGKHLLHVTARIEAYAGPFGSPAPSTLLHQFDRTMKADFEVLPAGQPNLLQPIYDPKLDAAMAAALKPRDFRYNSATHRLEGTIYLMSLPVDVAYESIARVGAKEYSMGSVISHPLKNSSTGAFVSTDYNDPAPATIDVILRPSETAAMSTVDFVSYWNHEVTFPGVPVSKH